MNVSWLHISDFHIRRGDPYDRDVVLRALVTSVARYRANGCVPDLIFATGDIAHSGKSAEYDLAGRFFDDLLCAAGLKKNRLFIIPGNHDVDRNLGIGLARTLESREDCDAYFNPAVPKPHITQKLRAFREWHNRYFKGIRRMPEESTCGPVECVEIESNKLGILPINTSLFCQDDHDHNNLFVGRRCLTAAIEELRKLNAHVNIALMHHPLDWLNGIERSNIKESLRSTFDFVLQGHLHETEIESVTSAFGQTLHCSAGAAYQTRKWPNRAMYASIKDSYLVVNPIRYEDQPPRSLDCRPEPLSV
jgi:UDP-2,3-diacylglucosamine pyrophosphatase LpxH